MGKKVKIRLKQAESALKKMAKDDAAAFERVMRGADELKARVVLLEYAMCDVVAWLLVISKSDQLQNWKNSFAQDFDKSTRQYAKATRRNGGKNIDPEAANLSRELAHDFVQEVEKREEFYRQSATTGQ